MEDHGQSASSERVIQFLKDFSPDQGSPTGEENLNIQLRNSIAGNYHLSQSDIYPEIYDWVFNYLDQRKCPNELTLVLANEVATHLTDSFPINVNEQDLEADFMFDSVLLYNSGLEKLNELCSQYRNNSEDIVAKALSIKKPLYLTSVHAIKNARRKMEDRHVVIHDLNQLCGLKNLPLHSYYAVFDGHAGVDAASYAASHLHWNIVRHSAFSTDLATAIKEAYIQTDEAFLDRSRRDNIKSGCTAVTCIIRENTLFVAWLGDSLAILVRQGLPVSLVEPHKPDKLEERQRIEEAGGMVAYVGTWRVNGTLAVSRAIGDIEHKPMVSNIPDIQKISLEGNEDFLVIGCDGLWDHLSPQDASASVYSKASDLTSDVDSIASCIVQLSKNQGSQDNITAIVVLFRERASLTQPLPLPHSMKDSVGQFDPFTPNGRMDNTDFGSDGPFSNNPFQQNWMDNPTESLESGKSIYVYNSGITVGDPIGANGPEEIFRPFTGVTLERTAISELPTPPIEDLPPTQQFTNLDSLNSESLEHAQSFNPFNEGESAMFEKSPLANVDFLSDMAKGGSDLTVEDVSLYSGIVETVESQSSTMVSSQTGYSLLTMVPECKDQIPTSKPWVLQVEHSSGNNEIDYLPNTEVSDILNAESLSQEPSSSEPQIYDFSGTMQLEEVSLDIGDGGEDFDPLKQVNLPIGSETDVSYHELNSVQDHESQKDLVSSLSEEAPSTIRAIHGIKEMIGISESVPGSKAQDPPSTTGNPFLDNPFSAQVTFEDALTTADDPNFDIDSLSEKADVVGDLLSSGMPDINHESLIESNVDPPEDEVSDHDVSELPDVLLPTLNSVKVDTPSSEEIGQESVIPEVPIDNLTSPKNAHDTFDLYPSSHGDDLSKQMDSLLIKEEVNLDVLTPTNDLIIEQVEQLSLQDTLESTLINEIQLLSQATPLTAEIPHEIPVSPINEVPISSPMEDIKDSITVLAADLASESMEKSINDQDVLATKQEIHAETESEADVRIESASSADDFVPENEVVISDLKNTQATLEDHLTPIQSTPEVTQHQELTEEITKKEDFSFSTQPETVKVDFSPTLNSEPTMSILSPNFGTVPVAEVPISQDTLGAPAVQLGKIPDGVPEADGVTEDADSDSEKDGGWSYVKATEEKNEDKKPTGKSTAATSTIRKVPGKDVIKPSHASKSLKPEEKAKKSILPTLPKTTTDAKKTAVTQSAGVVRKTLTSSKSAPQPNAALKTLKVEKPKPLSSPTAPKPKVPPITSVSSKVSSSTVSKTSISSLKSATTVASKTVSSASGVSKTTTKPAVSSKTEVASTLSKTTRPTTATTTGKSTITRTTIARTTGVSSSSKTAVSKTTTSATNTLSKSASPSTAPKTLSGTSRITTNTTTMSKVTKKPGLTATTAMGASPATKSPIEPKQSKESVNKQITRQTVTLGKTKTSTSTLVKTSATKTSAISRPPAGSEKPKSISGKLNSGITKSSTKALSKPASNLVNGNAEGIRKEVPMQKKELPNDQAKEIETIQAPVEPEKGVLEENHKEMPAVDSGLASPESLESPQNGLVSGDSNVTSSASMQKEGGEIVFNQ